MAAGSAELSDHARELIEDPDNDAFLSVVSVWEIATKNLLGRLPLPGPVERYVPVVRARHDIESLPLAEEMVLGIAKLPALHRDPFDRMLVSQAIIDAMTILTPDELVRQYPIRTVW